MSTDPIIEQLDSLQNVVTPSSVESLTGDALSVLNQSLYSDKEQHRIKAAELILARTLPARETRSLSLDVQKIDTLQQVASVAKDVFILTVRGEITPREGQTLLNLLESIKGFIIDAQYADDFDQIKYLVEKDPNYKSFVAARKH